MAEILPEMDDLDILQRELEGRNFANEAAVLAQ